ncbi:MAG: hypothetical protein J5862_01135, partial [Bacteroidales bacterium]|nr:hypothetical protein [Bacteroidales bacterium]
MYISSTKRLKNKRNILIKLTSLLAFFLISFSGIAQTALFSYQAVVRNSQNEIVANSTIGVRISLLRNSPSDPAEFAERHVVQTNANGLFTLLVGTGTNIFGNISTIDWGSYTYYLKSEIDPTGGTYYTITGTQPITGVPFAYYSLGTNYTEQQVISISNDTVFLTGGTNSFVKLPIQHITIPDSVSAFINDAGYITSDSIPSNVSAFNNDAGYITSAAIPTNVSAFNNDAGYITAYVDSQQISISNDTISLDRGGFVKLPAVNIPSNVSAFNNDALYITSDSIPDNVSAFNNDAGYITSAAIPTNVSAFSNDAGYITTYVDSQQIAISNDTIFLDRGGFVKLPVINIPSNVSAFNNDAGYITIDSIPSNVSAYNNDAGYITSADIPTNVSAFGNDAG